MSMTIKNAALAAILALGTLAAAGSANAAPAGAITGSLSSIAATGEALASESSTAVQTVGHRHRRHFRHHFKGYYGHYYGGYYPSCYTKSYWWHGRKYWKKYCY